MTPPSLMKCPEDGWTQIYYICQVHVCVTSYRIFEAYSESQLPCVYLGSSYYMESHFVAFLYSLPLNSSIVDVY